MTHYHTEVWLAELNDVENQIEEILAPFDERINDDGFWDGYQIGGRWTGEHDGYDPYEDEQNVERCSICHGHGFRNDQAGQEHRKQYPSYTCNGCGECSLATGEWDHGKRGTGKRTKWPTDFAAHPGDVMPVREVKEDLESFTLIVKGAVFHQEIWNGNGFQKTDYDGNVLKQLHSMGIRGGYLVTVDYHG